MDSIGMEHKLHLKKLMLARQKLTPLSAAEKSMASSVRREEAATAIREEIPDIDTAFSQVRCCVTCRQCETFVAVTSARPVFRSKPHTTGVLSRWVDLPQDENIPLKTGNVRKLGES